MECRAFRIKIIVFSFFLFYFYSFSFSATVDSTSYSFQTISGPFVAWTPSSGSFPTVTDVSLAVGGDTSRTSEIIEFNNFVGFSSIPGF